jgi:hypothetical protein
VKIWTLTFSTMKATEEEELGISKKNLKGGTVTSLVIIGFYGLKMIVDSIF